MARPDAIRVEGTVVDVMPRGVCRVELPNGHRLIALGAQRAGIKSLTVGQQVNLDVSPADLSKGRVVTERKH